MSFEECERGSQAQAWNVLTACFLTISTRQCRRQKQIARWSASFFTSIGFTWILTWKGTLKFSNVCTWMPDEATSDLAHTQNCVKTAWKMTQPAVLLRDILLSSRNTLLNLNYNGCIYAASLWGFLIQKLELSGCFLFSKFTCHKDLSVGWSEYWS